MLFLSIGKPHNMEKGKGEDCDREQGWRGGEEGHCCGGVECGEKGGRVAWKDPEDIKQEPCTTGRRQVMASTKVFCGQIQQLTIIVQQYIYMYKYYVILFLSMDKNHNMKDEMAKSLGSSPGVMSAKTGSLWWGM